VPGVVLALIEHPEAADGTLAAARSLAALMGSARITVLAVRVSPEVMMLPTDGVLTNQQEAVFRAEEQARVDALKARYEAWAAEAAAPGVAVGWADVDGLADAVVAEWGRRADFIVLGRGDRQQSVAGRLVVHAALFDTDRPVLVVPPGPVAPFGRRVAIAWRDDRRAIRSVLSALRLLARAEEIHVLAGIRAGAAPPVLPDILAEHGMTARLTVLKVGEGVFGATLLAAAHRLGVDMLVMGAFAHSPWRQLVLGGLTRHVLAEADVPVLMRH
jgi:nucleotide-binding universal stress UspA family protein